MKKISVFVLVFFGLIMIPFTTKAAVGDRMIIPGVEVVWTLQFDGFWTDLVEESGYWEWNLDDDYVSNLEISEISFNSNLSTYFNRIEFIYDDQTFSYNINSSYSFYFTYIDDGLNTYFVDIEVDNSVTTFIASTYTATGGLYIRLFDSRYVSTGSSYDLGYEQGLLDGELDYIERDLPDILDNTYNDGFDSGFDLGYQEGQSDMQSYYEFTVVPNQQDIYEAIGFQDAYDQYYMTRYNQGLADADGNVKALTQYIPGILGVVIGFFLQLASISFAGVSILDVIVAMFAVTVALLIFKIVIGGR